MNLKIIECEKLQGRVWLTVLFGEDLSDKVLGSFSLVFEGKDTSTVYLTDVETIKEYRHAGNGKKAVKALQEIFQTINLHVDTLTGYNAEYAQRLYTSCGFVKTSKRKNYIAMTWQA